MAGVVRPPQCQHRQVRCHRTIRSTRGAIGRFFADLFGGDEADDATRTGYTDTYNEAFNRGSYGVSVTTVNDDEADKAESILNAAGAYDIDEKAEAWRKEGWTGGAAIPMGMSGSSAALKAGDSRKLQEVEEELKVGKRAVAKGGVRIFTRMTEVPVSETVRLREEHADIKRTAVDRPATEADFAASQGRQLRGPRDGRRGGGEQDRTSHRRSRDRQNRDRA